jgi:hypothetical protein
MQVVLVHRTSDVIRVMVLNATFNRIYLYRGGQFLVEETEVPGEKPSTCRKSLTNCIT